MNEQQSWTTGRMIYAAIMSLLLLGYLAVIAAYSDPTVTGKSFVFPGFVWILRLVTAVMAVILGKLWKDKGFWLLMAYLLLKLVRVAVPDPGQIFTESVSESLLTGFWVFSACYGMAKVFTGEQLKRILRICTTVWTAGMVIYSGIGIYAAWTDQWIYTIGKGAIWGVYDNRLFLAYYVTVSGTILSVSAVIALCAAIMSRHRTNRILFLLSVIPMMIALSLTDSRGAQVSSAAGLATAAGILTLTILQHKERKPRIAWPVALAVTAAVFIAVVFSCMGTISVFNRLRAQGLVIPHALAEETEKTAMSNRGFTGEDVLTLRPEIWKAAIQTIKDDPTILLWGTSILNPMVQINALQYLPYQVAHCHCMPLMILLENGIPGVLLIGAFLLIAAKRALRLFRDSKTNLSKITIPVIVSIAVFELVECFTWLRSDQVPVLPFFFIAIGVIWFQTHTEIGIPQKLS